MPFIQPTRQVKRAELPRPDAYASVENAIFVLDTCWPGWLERVNPDRLEMLNSKQCLFVQATGSYNEAYDTLYGWGVSRFCCMADNTQTIKAIVRERQREKEPIVDKTRTPIAVQLYQWVRPGSNGETEDLGEYASVRAATNAARKIAKVSKLEGDFGATVLFSRKMTGSVTDGYALPIPLELPAYQPQQEFRLSDGRTVWLEDVDAAIRAALDARDLAKGQ